MTPFDGTPLALPYDYHGQFLRLSRAQQVLNTLWAAHTHVFRAKSVSPRAYYTADVPGAGKTTAMEVTLALSANPLATSYASQAAVHTWLDEHPDTTLGLDEADMMWGTTGRSKGRNILTAIVNAGYTSLGSALVVRNSSAVKIPVYCPVALAGIGALPGPLMSRSLVIKLTKALPAETWLPELYMADLSAAALDMARWLRSEDSQDQLAKAEPLADVPGDPRFRQIMAPLAAIADLAGAGELFRKSVSELVSGIESSPPTPTYELLLADLREVWPAGRTLLSGYEAIRALRAHPERRWDGMSVTRIGEMRLAALLREAGIETKVSNAVRGYLASDVMLQSVATDNTQHTTLMAKDNA